MEARSVGIPADVRRVHAEPDTEPATFRLPRCCYADWITAELMAATERGEQE